MSLLFNPTRLFAQRSLARMPGGSGRVVTCIHGVKKPMGTGQAGLWRFGETQRDPITHQGHRSPRWEGRRETGEEAHCSGTKDNGLVVVASAPSRCHSNKLPADQGPSFYKAFLDYYTIKKYIYMLSWLSRLCNLLTNSRGIIRPKINKQTNVFTKAFTAGI